MGRIGILLIDKAARSPERAERAGVSPTRPTTPNNPLSAPRPPSYTRTQGIPPASLQRVSSPELREFIALCIAHNPADRLSARELLKHHYLESVHADTSAHGGLPGSMSVSGGLAALGSTGGVAGAGGSVAAGLGALASSANGSGWNTPSGEWGREGAGGREDAGGWIPWLRGWWLVSCRQG